MPYSSCENYCMSRYSALSLIKNAISGHKNWTKSWQSPAPKKQYDAIIIGGGGHGLATAYYFLHFLVILPLLWMYQAKVKLLIQKLLQTLQ